MASHSGLPPSMTIVRSFSKPRLDYRVIKSLGAGGFGKVYQVKRLTDGEILAMKIVSLRGKHRDVPKEILFRREATALIRIRKHRYIVELEDILYLPEIELGGMIMSFAREGSLLNVFQRTPWDQHEALSQLVTYEMVEALHHIHTHNPVIVHRDIKPDNILAFVDDADRKPRYLFKLADFGISSTVDQDEGPSHVLMTGRAFKPYRAPETRLESGSGFHTRNYEDRADVYSLGVVIAQILNHTVRSLDAPKISGVPAKALSLLKVMVENDPLQRASAQDCKRFDWYRNGKHVVVPVLGRGFPLDESMKRLEMN